MHDTTALRLLPGIHPGIPEAAYHADPAEQISASASVLRTLYRLSPEHARYEHPRLSPDWQPSPSTEAQARGSILHAMVLEQPPCWSELAFDDFRSNAAKSARDNAIADGLIPILSHKLAVLHPVADALRARLAHEHPELFAALTDPETQREVTMIWRESGVLCRCRFDILPPASYGFTADLKFTSLDAEPEGWSRKLRDDYLFQSNLYRRAVMELRGDEPEFRFVVCETDPPYGVSVHAAGEVIDGKAKRQVNVALARWANCLKMNRWPGYPPFVHYAEAPTWWITQDEAASARDAFIDQAALLDGPEDPAQLDALISGPEGDRLSWGG